MEAYNVYCELEDLFKNEMIKGRDVVLASMLIDVYEERERWTTSQYGQASELVDKYEKGGA